MVRPVLSREVAGSNPVWNTKLATMIAFLIETGMRFTVHYSLTITTVDLSGISRPPHVPDKALSCSVMPDVLGIDDPLAGVLSDQLVRQHRIVLLFDDGVDETLTQV